MSHQPAGGLAEQFPALVVKFQIHYELLSAVIVLNHTGLGGHHVLTVHNHVLSGSSRRRLIDRLSVRAHLGGFIFPALPEGQQGGCGKLLYGSFRIEVGLILFPRKADDDLSVIVIRVKLIIGDVVIHHTELNNGLRGLHILSCSLHAVRGAEGSLHAAFDVNTPSDIVKPLYVGNGDISVPAVDAEKRHTAQGDDQEGNDKKYRFCYSLHAQILQCSLVSAKKYEKTSPKTAFDIHSQT